MEGIKKPQGQNKVQTKGIWTQLPIIQMPVACPISSNTKWKVIWEEQESGPDKLHVI